MDRFGVGGGHPGHHTRRCRRETAVDTRRGNIRPARCVHRAGLGRPTRLGDGDPGAGRWRPLAGGGLDRCRLERHLRGLPLHACHELRGGGEFRRGRPHLQRRRRRQSRRRGKPRHDGLRGHGHERRQQPRRRDPQPRQRRDLDVGGVGDGHAAGPGAGRPLRAVALHGGQRRGRTTGHALLRDGADHRRSKRPRQRQRPADRLRVSRRRLRIGDDLPLGARWLVQPLRFGQPGVRAGSWDLHALGPYLRRFTEDVWSLHGGQRFAPVRLGRHAPLGRPQR